MASPLQNFFEIILHGESKTYNDHNWYVYGDQLKGFIEGRSNNPYPLLNKPLTKYTIDEVIAFQNRQRDGSGQLWATGRYQIVPKTLKGLLTSLKLSTNKLYDQQTQDLMGYQLLMERPALRQYLKGEIPDTIENKQKAALDVAKIWSSVGVPFETNGSIKKIKFNESYYSGGGDKASTDSIYVQEGLKMLRENADNVFGSVVGD